MKKLLNIFVIFAIFAVVILTIFGGCASLQTPEKEPVYTIVTLDCVDADHDGITVKLPEGTPDISTMPIRPYRQMSQYIMAYVAEAPNGNLYFLISPYSKCRLLIFVNCNCNEGNKNDSEYYIYPEYGGVPVRVDSWEEIKAFLGDYDPDWKQEMEKQRKQKGKEKV